MSTVDLLGERVAALIALHVEAKRYLSATEPEYDLSPASQEGLAQQGGTMTEAEAAAFAKRQEAVDAVRLHRADKAAKIIGRGTSRLHNWSGSLRAYAREHAR